MLREAGVAEGIRRDVDRLWQTEGDSELPELDLIDRMAATCALLDGRAASLLERCQSHYTGPELPDATWLSGSDVPRTMRDNLRLYYARWLAQHALYDEALAQLAELDLGNVVDPASVLFYRAVAHQQLVEPDEARAALVELLEHRDSLPERFLQVAQLLERDLAALEDESMQHIARRMSDIRRRLAYGRAGEHVQRIERGVVESLDEKIEQLEQQQQQQNQSPSGGMMAPMQPMDDSRLPSMQAPMQVDQRDIGHRSGWGDLPPREREQALQAIGREFPAHYRDLIEQYFRELAAESPGADR
ncbi:MAG TPA: hypothetical protein PKC18_04735 [Lacipirellulaceae bacterium]|nr:hypothetical protein [Lacipirellulaceae bacterium]HMP08186.1 hypothetical protein [Lacipirellulaceae bacterium]